ncbi:hypothetical protein ACIA8F_24135 [Streptomyces sp. NPDC051563]|uniref:hypothetical protein n=1 Tax=Streptomyces sp. NPDC051563 TaxID=3365659 RepID=UPI0037A4AEE2
MFGCTGRRLGAIGLHDEIGHHLRTIFDVYITEWQQATSAQAAQDSRTRSPCRPGAGTGSAIPGPGARS